MNSQPIRFSNNFITFIPSLTITELWVVSIEHLQRVWHTRRERLPFRIPGSVVVLQTFPLADLPPGRSATLQTSPPRKICNIADLPPEDLQHCRPSPLGGRFVTLQIFPVSLQIFPRGRSATLQTFPHFCKLPDSHFLIYRTIRLKS